MFIRIASLCVCFALGCAVALEAQQQDDGLSKITAGSAEDKAFMAVKRATTPEAQIEAILDFEKRFPKSSALASMYTTMLGIYLQKNDTAKLIEIGEKVIKLDAKNMTALLALSRGYALGETPNVEKAKAFADQANALLTELRAKPPQPGFSESEWKAWLKQNDESVGPWVEYVKALE
jgi:tetratricopeptide (TPR) repeat protein